MSPKANAAVIQPSGKYSLGFIPAIAVLVQHRRQTKQKFIWKDSCLSNPCAVKEVGINWQNKEIKSFTVHHFSHYFTNTQCLDGLC